MNELFVTDGLRSPQNQPVTTLLISEIFGPTIQGEGALIGQPTVFVRTGGCDYRCSWCDSLHAVDSAHRADWQSLATLAVWQQIEQLSGGVPLLVTLSGGNPAIQPFGELIAMGQAKGYRFALETQGSIARNWFGRLDHLVLSPKPPSSGMAADWAAFDNCIAATDDRPETILKIVVFDEQDYQFARQVSERYPQLDLCLQPGNHTPPLAASETAEPAAPDLGGINERLDWLIERVMQDKWFKPRILPQLHVMLWGNRRGV